MENKTNLPYKMVDGKVAEHICIPNDFWDGFSEQGMITEALLYVILLSRCSSTDYYYKLSRSHERTLYPSGSFVSTDQELMRLCRMSKRVFRLSMDMLIHLDYVRINPDERIRKGYTVYRIPDYNLFVNQ